MSEQAGEHSPNRFPKWLGQFERECPLGRGGMGEVYRYKDHKLRRQVALKTLPERHVGDPLWRRRMRLEAQKLAQLTHPNVAQIYELIEDSECDYLVIEYVAGRTLAEELKDARWPVDKSLRVCLQVAEAIEAGHKKGFIHRDVKPPNIMIAENEIAKLLDFGLAKVLDPSEESFSDGTTVSLSRPTKLDDRGWGTPGYMSPEQARSEDIDERADIWALGCVLFECLTWTRAFPGGTEAERLRRTCDEDPPWERLPVSLPAPLTSLLKSCLEKDREQRPRNIACVCLAIRAALGSPTISPAPAGATVPNNIPAAPLTGFVGRPGTVGELALRVAGNRLVIVTGPPGVGKTRLAQECGRFLAGEGIAGPRTVSLPDGVWLVNLASEGDAQLVAQTIASALVREGVITLSKDRPVTRDLIDGLRAKVLLLILDNCDPVSEACGELLSDLLATCPQVRVVVTSRRQSLCTEGGQLAKVEELSFPAPREQPDPERHDAIRLFIERARLAQPGFSLTGRNADSVAAICRRLQGIPQAILLAASRLNTFDVEALASRLFDVLDPAEVLESSLGWSVEQLADDEQVLLGRLSVFRGGWTIDGAERICGDGDSEPVLRRPVIQLLANLVDQSIVACRRDDEGMRYYLLDTVRALAERKLREDAAAVGRTRGRYVDYFADLAEDACTASTRQDHAWWLSRLESEHGNLVAALEIGCMDGSDRAAAARMATSLQVFWTVRGYHAEGRAWLDRIAAERDGARDEAQIRLLNALGTVAAREGDTTAAKEHYRRGIDLAAELDDRSRLAGISSNLGWLLLELAEVDEAIDLQMTALETYQALGNRQRVAMVQLHLGDAWLHRCVTQARRWLEMCLPVFREHGDTERIAATQRNLGEVAFREGNLEEAAERLRDALDLISTLRDKEVTAEAVLWIGKIWAGRARPAKAAWLYAAADAMLRSGRWPRAFSSVFDDSVESARSSMDGPAFAEAWSCGQAADYDEVVACAMQGL